MLKLTIDQNTGIGTWSKETVATGVGATSYRKGTKSVVAGANTVTFSSALTPAPTVIIPYCQNGSEVVAGSFSAITTAGFTWTSADSGTLYYFAI
jgi:hypothetical protein